MGNLLLPEFPGLVPVSGGADSGTDGAIPDGDIEPFPLVCTTGKDVIRNLTRSLDSRLKLGRPPGKVVLATSRRLTPKRRFNLEERARSKGFQLIQIFEQDGIADRLYRNTRWCRELLDLPGLAPALSVVPLTRRPLIDLEPIGREADLEWLFETREDRVLSGEPGSGKTFLAYYLMRKKEWDALFLTDTDEAAISEALRDQRPSIVVVDDAHVNPAILERLVRLRRAMGADFVILAMTWEGGKEQVIGALGGLPDSRVRKLQPLARDKIVEVFRSAGVQEDNVTMRHLVDQASNKPGLAITIATLWLQDAWKEVVNGTALRRNFLGFFQEFVGPDSADVLAAFSLGGSPGVSLEAVREYLGIDLPRIRRITAGLAAGGVLSEVERGVLAVWPRLLRYALVREVFLSSSGIDYRPLLEKVESFEEGVETLIAAAHVAQTPSRELQPLVARTDSARIWKAFAFTGEDPARWVLENYPRELLDVAEPCLLQVPRATIPKILDRAAQGDLRPDRPMSLLSSWAREARLSLDEAIRRRRMLARASRDFLLAGGERGIGVHGISTALSPSVRGSSLDPGLGSTVSLISGLLRVEGLRQLESVWEEAQGAIQEIDKESWGHLSSLLWDWIHPSYSAPGGSVSEEQERVMRLCAERMIKDLATRAEESPGLKAELNKLAEKIRLDLGFQHDPVYAFLYPEPAPSIEERRERESSQKAAIEKLASEWAEDPPGKTAARVAFYEKEARRAGHTGLQNAPDFCRALAGFVEEPEVWLRAFLAEDLPGYLVSPFLERIVELRRAGWEEEVESSLMLDSLAWSAHALILTLPNPPASLLNRALGIAADFLMQIESMCLRKEVPLSTLKLLFGLPWEVALAAAVGEWVADPEGEVREEIRTEWRAAILRAKTGEYEEATQIVGLQYWLGVILARDADLSLDWLRARLEDDDLPWGFLGDSPFAHAIRALRREQRFEILEELPSAPALQSILPNLIQNDLELYRVLLARPSLRDYHLKPLEGLSEPGWDALAIAAIEVGHDPARIAAVAFGSSHFYSSWGIEYWSRWDEAFAKLEDHPNVDLREVARHGRKMAKEELDRAEERQRQAQVHGLGAA